MTEIRIVLASPNNVPIENNFDATFATTLALREKQIQQSYRPLIGIHKWFARRPGTLFRSLLLSEYNGSEPLESSYWRSHQLRGTIADPFMGGGTTVFEGNRLGMGVIGSDINPLAYWIVRQALAPFDSDAFLETAESVINDVEQVIGSLYRTRCERCRRPAAVKYFMWVKTESCPYCHTLNDLFPGYLLAEAVRHPFHVVVCHSCGNLNEYDDPPTRAHPRRCTKCRAIVAVEGPARRQMIRCRRCDHSYRFPQPHLIAQPPKHRLWALEYHCGHCKPDHKGRFFKVPTRADLERYADAAERLADSPQLPIPDDEIPAGDETARLLRWGYRRYREMFNDRQLLGLGVLLNRILAVQGSAERDALMTVFSDFLRYQNMLCRYDTYALKCQDIFSVHGFPVGLIQCENTLLGVPRVGSGAFRHFIEKYLRAKAYCSAPFETRFENGRKCVVAIRGEQISAQLATSPREVGSQERAAWIGAGSAAEVDLRGVALDGVFTDPPFYDNVQYAELMDFCYVWLRIGLSPYHQAFGGTTTRHQDELTGNATLARGLDEFTKGLSAVFSKYAAALKPNAPFVFTYDHNDPFAYLPIVVAVLDAGLNCTATLPAAGEMGASLHIAGTGSSVLDSVFVCRPTSSIAEEIATNRRIGVILREDADQMRAAGVRVSEGDLRCLLAGHVARIVINRLRSGWDATAPLSVRVGHARADLALLMATLDVADLVTLAKNSGGGRSNSDHRGSGESASVASV